MAVAKMSHLRLIGLRSEENKILDVLTERGLFEARATDEVSYGLKGSESTLCKDVRLKQSRVSFALDFIRQRYSAMASMLIDSKRGKRSGGPQYEYELKKRKFSASRMLITHADFSDVRAKEYALLDVCDTLQQISFDIIDCRTRINELKAQARAYEPYVACPLRFSVQKRVGDIEVGMFFDRSSSPCEDILRELHCAYDHIKAQGSIYTVVYRQEHKQELEKRMSSAGYEKCAFTDDCTAAQKLDAIAAEKRDVDRRIFELTKKALDYEKYYNELRILYDVFELEVERGEADERFLKTDATFVLEGWLPEAYAKTVTAEIREKYPKTFMQLLAPEERDAPPTLVQSAKIVAPYEEITNMYSPPKYRELDPNPIMSIFFFVFFGLMTGDAGYGLLLAAFGIGLGLSKKFDKGAKNIALLVGMGGISAIIWGIMFGGYFAIEFETPIAVWFNPLDEPIKLLVLSLALGALQLFTGYVIQFIKLCMAKKPFDAICDAGPIIILFGALACLVVPMLVEGAPPEMTTAAIVLAAIGVAIMVIFGGRKHKKLFGKIFGGLTGLYGLVNLFSDILSYCRLFGLCLASCAIGFAFNTLGGMIFAMGVPGYILGGIVMVILHAFNIGIGVLGAYVHNARLQFLEFYGKFYDGGGRMFTPLGARTKHTRYS